MAAKRKSTSRGTYRSRGSYRALRGVFSIVILAALILGVSYFVKFVSTLDSSHLISMSKPVLNRLGVDQEQAKEVAGKFSQRVGQTGIVDGINGVDSSSLDSSESLASDTESEKVEREASADYSERIEDFTVVILSDSHEFNGLLDSALKLAQQSEITTIFHLGDFTDWGDLNALRDAKEVMDSSKFTYYTLPGDHDIAQTSSDENYVKVFGEPNRVVALHGTKFLLFDNSANKTPISQEKMDWFVSNVKEADFVLLSQPIYTAYGGRTMGVIDGQVTQGVKDQADSMLAIIRESKVRAVISGDLHVFSKSKDPEKLELSHVVIGAVKNSRMAVLNVFESGDFEVVDEVIK